MAETLAHYIAGAITLLCFLSLYRAIIGPATEDRLIATSVITTKAILVLIVWASASGTYEFFDVALVCVLLNFTATVAVLKGLSRGGLG